MNDPHPSEFQLTASGTPALGAGSAADENLRTEATVIDAAEKGAVFFAAPDRGTIVVRGGERKTWLNGLITSDLAPLAPGVASYGLFLVKVGRILADAWVLDAGDRLLVAVPRDKVDPLRAHLEHHLLMEDASHDDASEAFVWAHLHGREAPSAALSLAAEHGGFAGALDVTGLGGAVLAVAPGCSEAVLRSFAAGAGESGEHPRRIGSESDWSALRLARGLPLWGVDFSEKHYPQEAGLEKLAVSFQKGCYLGQEVVCRLEMRGHVIKKNVVVEIEAPEPPAPGSEVRSVEGKPLGSLSSAGRVPRYRFPRALAMLRYDHSNPGTQVMVGQAPGRVVEIARTDPHA